MKRTKSENPAVVLEAAADLLERDGWCRGTFEHKSRHCAIGAICAVSNTFAGQSAARDALEAEIGSHRITLWNDAQKDKRTVIRTMRRAAARMRGKDVQ